MRYRSPLFSQKGLSLIEVLVAALILGVGLLGVLTQQSRAVQFNQQAYYYSQANILIQDIAERMRANSEAADAYSIADDATPPAAPSGDCRDVSNPCSSAQLAASDLADWVDSVQRLLPGGKASIGDAETLDGLDSRMITVQFDGGTDFSDDLVTETISVVVEL